MAEHVQGPVAKLDDLFELREVKGQRVFIVDDHHKALGAWALIRRERDDPPILISFDHHTDTHEAFLGAASAASADDGYDHDVMQAARAELMKKLGWQSDAAVLDSVAHLRHDEHIDAAAACGILRASFSIQLSDSGGTPSVEGEAYGKERAAAWPAKPEMPEPAPPFTFVAEHNVFVVGYDCFIGCESRPHTDDCTEPHYSQVLESAYVEDQLARAAEMARCIGIEGGLESAPYILDIDLDVFHTVASIEPKDPASFYRLIRGALAITIATEAECVDDLWHEDEKVSLSSEELLDRLLDHVAKACA